MAWFPCNLNSDLGGKEMVVTDTPSVGNICTAGSTFSATIGNYYLVAMLNSDIGTTLPTITGATIIGRITYQNGYNNLVVLIKATDTTVKVTPTVSNNFIYKEIITSKSLSIADTSDVGTVQSSGSSISVTKGDYYLVAINSDSVGTMSLTGGERVCSLYYQYNLFTLYTIIKATSTTMTISASTTSYNWLYKKISK